MKSSLVVSGLALVLSVIGLATALKGSRALEREPPSLLATDPNVEILERLVALTEELHDVRERLEAIELRPAPAAQRAVVGEDSVSTADLDALREELLEALADRSTRGAPPAASPGLEEQVTEALEKIRTDEEFAKAAAGHAKRAAAVEQRVRGWSKWLQLDDSQQAQMTDLMRTQDLREGEVLQAWEAGTEPAMLKQMRSDLQDEFVQSVRGILTPQQAAVLNEKFGAETSSD